MIAKCPCQNCGINIEFEVEGAGQFCPCPSCGKQTRLLLPSKPFTNSPAAATSKKVFAKLSPQAAVLKQIREQSCYKTLRVVIEVSTGILLGVLVLVGLGEVVGLRFGIAQLSLISTIPVALIGLATLLLVMVLVLAMRQSVLLLIDIADCQIHQIESSKLL